MVVSFSDDQEGHERSRTLHLYFSVNPVLAETQHRSSFVDQRIKGTCLLLTLVEARLFVFMILTEEAIGLDF